MQTFEKIKQIIQDLSGIPADKITLESTLEQLNLHQLDLAEVVFTVEEEFDVVIHNEASISRLKDLVNLVADQIEAA
ncbi:MAG: Acyl carrier protein [Firmicutes bacterium ADurb.Bin182]|nr:MAG: Acyl carrier protein [Firmicutes bacterium ADurb.Bin182]